MKKLVCKKCGNEVLPEKDKALKKEYPYYIIAVFVMRTNIDLSV